MNSAIPFNRPHLTGHEQSYISEVLASGQSSAGGVFSQRCEDWLQKSTGSPRVLLTHSCTNALEMAAVLAGIRPGDEVIMPSFTFTSTANAFLLRGAVPVFVDIRPDTLNIDETLIEAAITPRTRAIVPVHYAGVACEMDSILEIAKRHDLLVIEDAAQCLGASYKGSPLGTLGDFGCYSFHASKNISSGEGGALLINQERYINRAEIIHDKGTSRAQFRAGKVRQYDWLDVGMSAPPSELQAAFLLAQLEGSHAINAARLSLWERYMQRLAGIADEHMVLPNPPVECSHNAHIFALLFDTPERRDQAQQALAQADIQAALHYQPLHLAPAGKNLGRCHGAMTISETLPQRLLRLPLWPGMTDQQIGRITDILAAVQD